MGLRPHRLNQLRAKETSSYIRPLAPTDEIGVEGLPIKENPAYLVPQIKNFVETPEIKQLKKRIKIWLKIGHPVHIIGPTGCGKTTIAMQVAKELGRSTVWINGDGQMTTTDLIGGYSQVEVESLRDKYIHNVFKSHDTLSADWVDNPLTIACKFGFTLVYNEFSRSLPVANNVLLSVFQEGILELPTHFGKERYVKVHPDFRAIFTSNPVEYAGVHRPQDALLDRMIGVYMDFYDFDTEVKIVEVRSEVSTKLAKEIVKAVRTLRAKLPEAERPGTRAAIMVGQAVKESGSENLEQILTDIIVTKTKGTADLSKKLEIIKSVI
ncbi:MAG: gas vesicle protein GvpN [Candidatus Aenigmarchaeota archaeon]|nr:gas vesicle protein GvpN [Candidatus Aenigmarchaeota archaeon]